MKRRILCLLTAAVCMAGCAPAASSLPTQAGGWVETEITPEGMSPDAYDRDLFAAGSTIRIVEKSKDAIVLYTSTDRGGSWQRTVPDWAQLPDGTSEAEFVLSPEGAVYMRAIVGVPQEGSSHLLAQDRLYFWQDGWRQIPVEELVPAGLPDGVPDNIWQILPGGKELVVCRGMAGESFGVLRADGAVRSCTAQNAAILTGYPMILQNGRVWGNSENDQIFTLDIEKESCQLQPSGGQILVDVKDGSLYGMRGNSVYVRAENGTVWEQILDAGNAPRMQIASGISAVRALDSGCLVADTWVSMSSRHGAGARPQLLRYDYDPDLVRTQTRELTVYSLEESATVRQAVSQCSLEHPELKVRYEVGVQKGMEKEDAIRQLNTRLLAGEAPDVLILDGLPVDSLVRQGLLADLSSLADTGGLYPAARAGQTDGKLWYLAARMELPLLLGAGYEPPETLEQLAQAVGNGPPLRVQCPVSQRAVLGQPPEEIAAVLLPGMREKLLQSGRIDRTALEEFYTLAGRLSGAAGPEIREKFWRSETVVEKVDGFEGTVEMSGMVFFPYSAAAGMKILGSLTDLCETFYSKTDEGPFDAGPHVLRAVPGAEGVYLPSVMAGIPAANKNSADAAVFLETLLSHAVQQYELGDGLPVRPESLQSQWELQPMREYLPHAGELLSRLEPLLAAADVPVVPDYFEEVVLETAKQDLLPAESAAQVCEQLQTWLAEQS